jgi:hypothetical protein
VPRPILALDAGRRERGGNLSKRLGVQTPMSRISRSFLPLTVGLSILLAACAAGAGGSPGPVQHPAGDKLVLRVAFQGGFVAPQALLTRFPSFSMFGDGRMIIEGAQTEIYPGPALAPVLVRRLTEAGVQAVLSEVLGTGAFAANSEFRGAQNLIADAPDTVFTLHADGRTVTVVVYGLNELDTTGNAGSITSEEIATYRALSHLNERLSTLDQWLPASDWADPAWSPFVPGALRLIVHDASGDQPDESGIANQLVPWPGSSEPATFGAATTIEGSRCGVVSGDEAAAWNAALGTANQLTRFVKGGLRYEVMARQLLPDEPLECPPTPA